MTSVNTIIYPASIRDRLPQLSNLNRARNDYSKHRAIRRQADMAHKSITKQILDPIYVSLRERLIRAVKARDEYAEWKISCQIKEYLNEPLPVNPNWHR